MKKLVWILGLCALAALAGCGDDDGGSGGGVAGAGGSGGSGSDWPPSATVHFDDKGVLSADCATDEDCAMVLGYYHAKERFVQMDIRRRFTTGRLTDFLNPALLALSTPVALPAAISNRALFSSRDGEPLEEVLLRSASPKTLAMLEAYALGVNRWLDDLRNNRNGAQLPREFGMAGLQLLQYGVDDVPDWTMQDSIAAVLALIESLTNDEAQETAAGAARAAIDDDARFQDLYSVRPIKESSVLPAGTYSTDTPSGGFAMRFDEPRMWGPWRNPVTEPSTTRVLARATALQREIEKFSGMLGVSSRGNATGSNNWVVSPSQTTDGNALLSNDPHLTMTQPATWYLAHLDAKTNGTGTLHTSGVTFAGLPWVVIGQNEDIAWGATTTTFDASDVYVETLVRDGEGNPQGVMFNGEVVDFVRVDTEFPFQDGTVEQRELLFVPHHGPVRSEITPDDTTVLTLRWTGQDVDTDINALTELGAATTVQEARTALENVTTLGQNWVVADKDGNIGWFPYNRLPTRPWATSLGGGGSPWIPLDGTGAFEWGEPIPVSQLPQALNPSTGLLATANNDMTGALFDGDPTNDGHPVLQSSAAAGYRHARIAEQLDVLAPNITAQTMLDLVGDVHSLIGEDMTAPILSIANAAETTLSPAAQQVVNAMAGWAFTCPTGLNGIDAETAPLVGDADELRESAGCAAFHVALQELNVAIVGDDDAPGGRGPNFAAYYSIIDPTQLNAGDVYWDDQTTPETETRFDIVAAALDAAGQFLIAELGNDETQWAWGRLHTLVLLSDLDGFLITDFNNPPPPSPGFANDGGLFTVDVANPSNRQAGDAFEASNFQHRAGPSMRLVCEAFSAGPQCTIQVPGGQSGDIDSPNYENLLPDFLSNTPMALPIDIAAAASGAAESLTGEEISP